MSGKYIDKVVDPPLEEFAARQTERTPAVIQFQSPEAVDMDNGSLQKVSS